MNSRRTLRKNEGGALLTALLFCFIAVSIVGAFLGYVGADSRLTSRSIDFQKARIAAESAVEYGTIQLKNIIMRNQLSFLSRSQFDALLAEIPPPPPLETYAYQTPGGAPAFEVVSMSDVQYGPIERGTFSPRTGEYQLFRVRAGAINPGTGVGSVMARDLQGAGLFLIRFGVFYEEILEIAPGANMSFEGWVHANGEVYMDSQATLRFGDRLTSAGNMHRGRLDRSQYNPGSVRIRNAAGTDVSMDIDSSTPTWMSDSINLWNGRVLSRTHGYPRLDAPIDPTDVPHDLVERPIAAGTPGRNEATESEKFANKACLTIRIHADNTLSARDSRGNDVSSYFTAAVLRVSGTSDGKPLYSKNSASNYTFSRAGAYGVTNHFYDAREQKTMAPVDIYVNTLTSAFPQVANSTYGIEEGRGVVYVTRDDPDGAGGVQPCVRIRNGTSLPHGGLTFASDLPIYVEGDYNIGTVRPALLTGDAVTFLSRSWQDAYSSQSMALRSPANSTYNTVIMTGNSPTSWGNYNGGLENVLRFLEDWSGKTVTYRGSIIDLWHSEIATGAWRYGSPVYTAPTRNWGYDPIYNTQVPPGMTRVFGVEVLTWEESSWAAEGWY